MPHKTEYSRSRYPQASIAEGAKIAETCQIAPGCQVSAESEMADFSELGTHVKLVGRVQLGQGVIIRENTTLVGPLQIGEWTVVGPHCVIGGKRSGDNLKNQGTILEKGCQIGKGTLVLSGVHLGAHVRVRAGSRVIGDVPDYGLASGTPAILERYACPVCAWNLVVKRVNGDLNIMMCAKCRTNELRFRRDSIANKLNRVLLLNNCMGELVSMVGYDPHWSDEQEMV